MIYPAHMRDFVIKPVLEHLGMMSYDALQLVFGTFLTESTVGTMTYLKQAGDGPALGPFQMEPATWKDIHENWLKYKPEIKAKLDALGPGGPEQMIGNHYYAAAMCRIHYRRVKAPIPGNLQGWAQYWKRYYNTILGAGTPQKFEKAYRDHAMER